LTEFFPAGVKSYVLRAGRMTEAQRRSYETLACRFCIPFVEAPLDFEEIFGRSAPVVMEIGFGMGIATAEIAARNAEVNYLGVEVHRPGIGRLLWEIEKRGLENLRIIERDAVEVAAKMLPDQSLAGIHLFFPDPWPKKRHHKRRLVTRPFTALLARKLQRGGYLYMVTDWEDYAQWALKELSGTPGLKNPFFTEGEGNEGGGFAPPQSWRPRTKFEQKGIDKAHQVRELFFITAE